ncbi:MAG: sulfatase [Fuerstiella sp.]|nr:sulfatase [Fuerstiella sp.]MCP4857738.1 sulfatase [Fuerstiella sp.]
MKTTTFTLVTLAAEILHAADTPNFVIIYADDLGYTQTSVPMMKDRPGLAHKLHQTPNLEKLAQRGMRFSNAYCPSPVCTSSRASIQHGKTTARVGCISIHDVVMNKKKIDLGKNLSIAEMIKEADKGHVTAFFGKGCSPMHWFKDHGYDVTDFNHKNPNGNGHGDWWEPADRIPVPLDDPKRVFSLARTAGDFLKERAKDRKPFYLMVSHYAVHVRNTSLKTTREKYLKIVAADNGIEGGIPDISRFDRSSGEMPRKLQSLWERANYAAMMENMDSSIGMVLDELTALGMEENTYVIFSSDNGGGQSNAPLQGGKAKMWEGGLRIPMIVAGPGIAANSQCDKPVAQWDYLTTMHDLVGSTAALPDDLDGISLRPVLEQGNDGKLAERDSGLVFHFPAHYTVPITAYRDGDFKLMRHLNSGEIKMFNVDEDMGESNDLSKTMPEKTADMVRKLDAYLEKVGAWKMEEVYATRTDELEKWIADDKQKVANINQQLTANNLNAGDRKKLAGELKSAQSRQTHHRSNLEKLNLDRKSTRWF